MERRKFINALGGVSGLLITSFILIISMIFANEAKCQTNYDIVIYGDTSAGITAAIQSSRMGKSVLLIEPTSRIGGLTTGGLGATDIGNKQAIGKK